MADTIIKSDVFKFVALRPPVSIEKKNQETNFIADNRVTEQTPVARLASTFNQENSPNIPDRVKEFIHQHQFSLENLVNPLGTTLSKIDEFVKSVSNNFSNNALKAGIENILDKEVSEFLADDSTKRVLDGIWDRYYAFFLLNRTEPQNLENLTQNLRTFHLLDKISKDEIKDKETLNKITTAAPQIPKFFTDLPKPFQKSTPVHKEQPSEETIEKYKELWNTLVDTQRAINEVKTIKFENKISSVTKEVSVPDKCSGKEVKTNLASIKTELVVNSHSFDQLHSGTKSLLHSLNISENNLHIPSTLSQLHDKLEQINLTISNIKDPHFLSLIPENAKNIPGMLSIVPHYPVQYDSVSLDINPPIPFRQPINLRKSIRPLGIGDLKVVKQKLKKYVAGEVSHIENILKGESKNRKHRILDRTEDIFTISTETNEETTKDTQTTERFELKKESEKTVQEQMSIQAGVTVSGSYGTVTFGAHGDFAYSTSTVESNKNSSNFAREVVDKSVSKIQKKTAEERTTKKLHEVEEINEHGFNNVGGTDHISGIYRWVDKYYEAQIYNYGKRMMFEFIIPEPAAFFEYAQTHKPKKNIVPPTPFALTNPNQIDEKNYIDYIRDYNVQGVTPPPILYKTVSIAIVKDEMPLEYPKAHVTTNKELIIPVGYKSTFGVWFDCSAYYANSPHLEVIIGNKFFRLLQDDYAVKSVEPQQNWLTIPFHPFYEGSSIQVSINSYDIISYTLNAYITVERTPEALMLWKIQVFEKIMNAYKAMQIEYEQKLAAQETEQGIAIHGQNPQINREIEKTELKKHCIKMLMDTNLYGSFDAMKDLYPGLVPPEFDIFDAFQEGRIIQFFEQAFEWENITYLFYPYFWARKEEQWINKSTTYDTDPLFTKFLQAGSARVVIPVHPAYNNSILYYLQTGLVWNGGEVPGIKDLLFISIADELKNQTDDLANATPEGEPWEVILPTTLVYLQKDSDLPTF